MRHPFDEELVLPEWPDETGSAEYPDAPRLQLVEVIRLILEDVYGGDQPLEAGAVLDSLEDRGYRVVES